MSFARSVVKNVFFKGLGEVLIRGLSFAFMVLVARTLKAADFGALNFAYSFPLLFIILADFGFNPLLIREISRDPGAGARVFGHMLYTKLALSGAFVVAVVAGVAVVAPPPGTREAVFLLTGFMLLNSFTEFFTAVFQAHQQMQWEAGVFTWQKLLLLAFGLLALGLGWGLRGVAAAYLAAGVCGLAAALWVLRRRKLVAGAWQWDWAFWQRAFAQALPLTLTTLFINLYFRIDTTLLTKLRPLSEVGWYGAAHKCIEVLMVVPAVLVAATFPTFSKMFAEDLGRLQRAAERVLHLLFMLAVPLVVGAVLLARPLMALVFGPAFAPAGIALAWLSVALGFIFINYLLSYLLISAEHQRLNALVSGLAVLVSVGANLLLIPRWGFAGAGAAAAVTELILFLAYAACVRTQVFALKLSAPGRVLLAGVGMGAVVWLLRAFPVVPLIILGGLVYAGLLWFLRAVTPEDFRWLREKMQKVG
ncbi:MAG: flippase [Candidatus Firestonebacteria bacterium]|nr:flippase [Candidatus Firestonebacteria bacterium]